MYAASQSRQLKQFAISAFVCLPLAAWLCGGQSWTMVLAVTLGSLAMVLAWSVPAYLAPIYWILARLSRPIGMLVGELVLVLIYGFVFLPIGGLFRLVGRDALCRHMDRRMETYWEIAPDELPAKRYWRRY